MKMSNVVECKITRAIHQSGRTSSVDCEDARWGTSVSLEILAAFRMCWNAG